MKKLLTIMAVCGLCSLATTANAEPTLTSILDGIYGATNYSQILGDQFWGDLDGSVSVQAKYAADKHWLGYSTDEIAGTGPVWFSMAAGDPTAFDVGDSDSFDIVPNSDVFIWILKDITASKTWYSRDSLNADAKDHMWTFQIDTMTDTYAICWEDLQYPGWDADYQDLVVEVTSAQPIPVPGAIALGGLGLCLAGWLKRQRKL